MSDPFDVVVIGGGHNGLVAAGLLAKRGARVVVLERRPQVGGAAITETPWGPRYNVTSLSYVVSLMPPTITRDLDLARHGYQVFPQGGYFAPHRDGRALQLTPESIGQFSRRDVDTYPRWEQWLTGLAEVVGPLLTSIPPRLGSRRPRDLIDQGELAWRLRRIGVSCNTSQNDSKRAGITITVATSPTSPHPRLGEPGVSRAPWRRWS